jgi:transcriptional regulator with XRE-family HTH domain
VRAIWCYERNAEWFTRLEIPVRSLARPSLSRLAIREGDRLLRRAAARFGEEIRVLRLRRGISQAAVARAVGVHRSVVSRLEAGDPSVSLRTRARVATVVGAELALGCYPRGRPTIVDAAQARLVEALLRMRDARWAPTLEAPVPGPGARSTDLRVDAGHDTVLIEVESRIQGLEGIIRECQGKRAAVAAVLNHRRVHSVLALPRTRHHLAIVHAHPALVSAAFPVPSPVAIDALRGSAGPWPGDAIVWVR